jgi:hypothetical protein
MGRRIVGCRALISARAPLMSPETGLDPSNSITVGDARLSVFLFLPAVFVQPQRRAAMTDSPSATNATWRACSAKKP